MPIHKLTLVARQEVAHGTIVFTFSKPADFAFKPGQYGGFTLINPSETDANGITRRFSLLNMPSDPHIMVATRIQNSAYKRVLNTLPIGAEIKFAGPTGNFILHENVNEPAVFIAGGIGITPFYSMIKDALSQQSARVMTLFYGNQAESDAAFLAELTQLSQVHANFRLVPTLANPSSHWQGEKGFITQSMIKKYVPDLSAPIYYVCGSPPMVTALQEALVEMDINEDRIRVEDFPGY